jgi:hypothetical protein
MAFPFSSPPERFKGRHNDVAGPPQEPCHTVRAYRTSVYGNTPATKIAALTTSSKDPVRDFHARDLFSWPVHPVILDEKVLVYQNLLGSVEVRVNEAGEREVNDIGAFVSGTQ